MSNGCALICLIKAAISDDFAASAWFCRGHHTTDMPVKSKLIAYRVYLSAASMKVKKELGKSFQIITAPSMLSSTELRLMRPTIHDGEGKQN